MGPVLRAAAVVGLLGLAPATVWGQTAERSTAALIAEQGKLRTDLDRVNAAIADIKKSGRGVRNDYLLRQRMADAEALARRLTQTESELRAASPIPRADAAPAGPEPEAAPTDGPDQLEAKADFLADQSRVLVREAETLSRRAGQIRGRQELRRRAGALDRDPFAGFEGSKRRTISITGGTPEAGGRAAPPKASGQGGQGGGEASGSGGSGGSGVAGGGLGPAGTGGSGGATGDQDALPPGSVPPLSVRERDLLDPAALAELRRLESGGAPGNDVQAMDRAAVALRERAARLDAQARALRERARR